MTWLMIASGAVAVLGTASLLWWAFSGIERDTGCEDSANEAGRQWAAHMIAEGITAEEARASIVCRTFHIGAFEDGALDYLKELDQ